MKLIATIFFAFCTLCKAYTAELIWFDGQHPITYQMPQMVEPVVKVALEMWKDAASNGCDACGFKQGCC